MCWLVHYPNSITESRKKLFPARVSVSEKLEPKSRWRFGLAGSLNRRSFSSLLFWPMRYSKFQHISRQVVSYSINFAFPFDLSVADYVPDSPCISNVRTFLKLSKEPVCMSAFCSGFELYRKCRSTCTYKFYR